MKKIVETLFTLQRAQSQSRGADENAAELQLLRTQIPNQVLLRFDRFLMRGKKGVAIVRNGVCSECHIKVAIGVFNALILGADIQACGSCGRYLYLPQEAIGPLEKNTNTKKVV